MQWPFFWLIWKECNNIIFFNKNLHRLQLLEIINSFSGTAFSFTAFWLGRCSQEHSRRSASGMGRKGEAGRGARKKARADEESADQQQSDLHHGEVVDADPVGVTDTEMLLVEYPQLRACTVQG